MRFGQHRGAAQSSFFLLTLLVSQVVPAAIIVPQTACEVIQADPDLHQMYSTFVTGVADRVRDGDVIGDFTSEYSGELLLTCLSVQQQEFLRYWLKTVVQEDASRKILEGAEQVATEDGRAMIEQLNGIDDLAKGTERAVRYERHVELVDIAAAHATNVLRHIANAEALQAARRKIRQVFFSLLDPEFDLTDWAFKAAGFVGFVAEIDTLKESVATYVLHEFIDQAYNDVNVPVTHSLQPSDWPRIRDDIMVEMRRTWADFDREVIEQYEGEALKYSPALLKIGSLNRLGMKLQAAIEKEGSVGV